MQNNVRVVRHLEFFHLGHEKKKRKPQTPKPYTLQPKSANRPLKPCHQKRAQRQPRPYTVNLNSKPANRPLKPCHEKQAQRQPVRDNDDARARVCVVSPQRLCTKNIK